LPDVRSDEDCRRLIATLEKPVFRGCFALIYAYGLRINEAVTLPVSAVDSKQMVLRVIGKRNKGVRPVNHVFTKIHGRARLFRAPSSPRWAGGRQRPNLPRTRANTERVNPKARRAQSPRARLKC
jgi:hypothetical protein